jgi:hypothetical protein
MDAEFSHVRGIIEDFVVFSGHCVKERIIKAWTIDQVEIGTVPETKSRSQILADLCQFKTPQMAKGSNSINGATKTAAHKREIVWLVHEVEYLVHDSGVITIRKSKDIHSNNGLKGLKDCG